LDHLAGKDRLNLLIQRTWNESNPGLLNFGQYLSSLSDGYNDFLPCCFFAFVLWKILFCKFDSIMISFIILFYLTSHHNTFQFEILEYDIDKGRSKELTIIFLFCRVKSN
jgi:hypothetical protein